MHTKPTRLSKFRVLLYFLALTLFFIVTLLSTGCQSDNTSNNSTQTGNTQNTNASPQTAPSPQATPKPPPTDEPIIVTGGSVDIYFDDRVYIADSGKTKYTCPSCTLKNAYVQLLDANGAEIGQCPIPDKTNAKVIIHAQKSGGSDKPIMITGKSAGVEVSFDDGEYSDPGKKHYSKDKQITKIEIPGGKDCAFKSNPKIQVIGLLP